jgi:hypothetical protein
MHHPLTSRYAILAFKFSLGYVQFTVTIQKYSIPTLSCQIVCDLLITVGMVCTLLSKRTQVRTYVGAT